MQSLLLAAMLLQPQTAPSPVATDPTMVKPIEVGKQVPNVKVQTIEGKDISLPKALGGKSTVLVFYRGGWCPFCNTHMAELGQIQGELRAKGWNIVAVSPDLPTELRKSVVKHELEYTLLSDAKAAAATAFGLAFRVDDKTFTTYKEKYGIDLEASSGQSHHILPVPAVVLVDTKGKIRFVHFNPDYRKRLSGQEILDAAAKVQ